MEEKRYKIPIGEWPKHPVYKDAGKAAMRSFKAGMHGWSHFFLTRHARSRWSNQEVNVYLQELNDELDKKWHIYWSPRRIWAQKPYDEPPREAGFDTMRENSMEMSHDGSMMDSSRARSITLSIERINDRLYLSVLETGVWWIYGAAAAAVAGRRPMEDGFYRNHRSQYTFDHQFRFISSHLQRQTSTPLIHDLSEDRVTSAHGSLTEPLPMLCQRPRPKSRSPSESGSAAAGNSTVRRTMVEWGFSATTTDTIRQMLCGPPD